ncbi:NUDIX hydrolase [Leifsonia sp. SIMBA_070]|uniref:NUDIX hydrolase n=1 Tax=Leifsonia sp. SIMBA_070 TaxID=3085810 RepID=UPI003979B3D7
MQRLAARVVVVNEEGQTLLLRGGDPARPEAGTWWFTPGGGVEGDETVIEAASRELREETGLEVEQPLGPIHRRATTFEFTGETFQQREVYFYVVVPTFEIDTRGWTVLERAVMRESRWWSLREIETTDETVYPENLAALLMEVFDTH